MVPSPLDTWPYRFLHVWMPPLFGRLYRMEITGASQVPRQGAVVLASNHLSNVDPLILGVACPRQIHFMAKAELWKVSPLGRLIASLGSFPVHRGRADREAVRRGLEVLTAGGVLGIFPEGHRHPEGRLGQPQPGVALFSLREGVQTVPVALRGTPGMLRGWRPAFPRLTVCYGPPLDLSDVAGSKAEKHAEVTRRLMRAIAALLDQEWEPTKDEPDPASPVVPEDEA